MRRHDRIDRVLHTILLLGRAGCRLPRASRSGRENIALRHQLCTPNAWRTPASSPTRADLDRASCRLDAVAVGSDLPPARYRCAMTSRVVSAALDATITPSTR